MSSRTDFKRHVTPPWGRSLSFWERFLITLRLDPHGRRRPPVPSTAHYTHRSVKGMVHATAEIKTVDDDVELSGTRLTLSTPGGLMAIELKGFTVPAVDRDWVEIFYAKIMTVELPILSTFTTRPPTRSRRWSTASSAVRPATTHGRWTGGLSWSSVRYGILPTSGQG